ncbi:MAG: ATP-binding cassette domain-containing protein [Oscillospiraceae bacterium]|nr:ATP-binding cassette domain-containing protein [Oscillospiraceae bacterium]
MQAQPIISIQNLSKTFHTKTSEVHALRNISLDILPGQIFGIIGMSGAGKSTLVRCMNFLEKPTGGTVLFDGVDLGAMNAQALNEARRSMGMIFQQFNLLMQRTALQNICFPMEIAGVKKEEAIARAKELLEIVDLADRADAYPSQLSGGQKQRVAIARALATNPKVLLCDEATSALDPKTTRSILTLLRDINRRLGITVIIITHEMSVIEEICTHVAIIADSQIAESGTVQEIFTRPKTAAAQKLVFHRAGEVQRNVGSNALRIVFDGTASSEPVIAGMVLEFKAPVNIMFADTRDIDGKAFGQMVLQMPEDPTVAEKMKYYLTTRGLTVEEVQFNV